MEYDWKALSIKQPTASLVVDGTKRVENRNPRQYKDCTLRGRWIMIHACLGTRPSPHPRGMVIGLARIEGVYNKADIMMSICNTGRMIGLPVWCLT